MAEFQDYPKYLYHPRLAPEGKRFETAKETEGLSAGWVDTPSKFPPKVNWRQVFKRLFQLIDVRSGHADYYSGPRFLRTVGEFDLDVPEYNDLIKQRNEAKKSTSRKDYFYDVLMDLPEDARALVVLSILTNLVEPDEKLVTEAKALLGGVGLAMTAEIPTNAWNSDRLTSHLTEIDGAIAAGKYDRAVTLSYTCLEGFYKAFVRAKQPGQDPPKEIVELAKWIHVHLKGVISAYPEELLSLVKSTAHAIDRARNQFSESHFDGEAARWMATYVRDLTHTQIRLLLHFM